LKRAEKAKKIGGILDQLYPTPPVPLIHRDSFTLLVAVLLSAQTTDARVNMVTPALFARASTPRTMAKLSVEEILQTPDVAERVQLYNEHSERAVEQIRRCAEVEGNLVVLDLREEEVIHPTNRFMVYALYPDTNVSIHVLWGLKQQNTVFAVGKSIINRSSRTNVGELMLAHGGGGHDAAGTCQVANVGAGLTLDDLTEKITADG